jgi:hypothetical protein
MLSERPIPGRNSQIEPFVRATPLASAVILFVAFGIPSVLFWAYFRFRPTPQPAAES